MADFKKARTVLTYEREIGDDSVLFSHRDTGLQLERDRWESMGKPGIVTVTVDVGDTLNP